MRCIFFKFKIRRVVFLSSKADALYFFLNLKSVTYRKFQFKFMLFRKARKMQNMSFSRSKENQNVIFLDANIFQILTSRKIFNSKSNALYLFQSKIWRVVFLCFFFKFKMWRVVFLCFFQIQNKTRCIFLNSKSDAL